MNYLAHACLSFGHPELLVGNMIADHVKGRARFGYSEGIQAGIDLHRRIDAFTDAHPATAAAKVFFRADYRLYSGAVVDVIFDHFVAHDADWFGPSSLFDFAEGVYTVLERYEAQLPPRFARMLPYMRSQNWLYHYKDRSGIAQSLHGLVRRAAYLEDADTAFTLFGAHYDALQEAYLQLAPDVKDYAKIEAVQLLR